MFRCASKTSVHGKQARNFGGFNLAVIKRTALLSNILGLQYVSNARDFHHR